ncbi:hypothetical protein TNCV_4788441 [Trichonephila clavipes]|nr:hypothetical protein TNCV_4788441 [Trichonephila clavipes]
MPKMWQKHDTRDCEIKVRQENPFFLYQLPELQSLGICYRKCPKFPKPKKGTSFEDPTKKKYFAINSVREGIFFANIFSGETPNQTLISNKEEKDSPRGFLSQENNASDLVQALELFNIISDLFKKNPKPLDLLSKFKNAKSEEEKTCLLAEALMNKV